MRGGGSHLCRFNDNKQNRTLQIFYSNLASPRGLIRAIHGPHPTGGFAVQKFNPAFLSNRGVLIPADCMAISKIERYQYFLVVWRPQGDSNPCCRRERAVS